MISGCVVAGIGDPGLEQGSIPKFRPPGVTAAGYSRAGLTAIPAFGNSNWPASPRRVGATACLPLKSAAFQFRYQIFAEYFSTKLRLRTKRSATEVVRDS